MAQTNSFLHPVGQIHFGTYKPGDVKEALDSTEEIAKKRLRAIAKMPAKDRTFENTVLGIVRATQEFDVVCHLVGHHESVLGEAWREADLLMTAKASKLHTQIFMDAALYKAVKEVAVPKKANFKRFYDDIVRGYERNGINLPADKQKIMKRLQRQLSAAGTRFAQNATKATDEAFLVVKSEAALKGMDQEFIDQCKKAAKQHGVEGLYIDHSEPTYLKVMTQCSVRRTRQRYFKLVASRGKGLNGTLVKKILALRQETAHLLGFAHFGDYIAQTRMAKKAATATALIDELTVKYAPTMRAEFEELQAFARKLEKNPKLQLDAADESGTIDFYYAAKLREDKLSINEQELKAYFPLESVLKGMFATLTTLYGVTFERINNPGWHKDVEVYAISNEAGAHIATVWCDWFARKGKRAGAWMSEYYVAERANGNTDQPHMGYVCANFDPPTKTRPALLSFRSVETIWHEFGHFMDLALSSTELPEQSMTGCWDFIEAPSQIMENWVWQPEVLSTFARHYQTGAVLPEEMLGKLQAARNFRVASKAMRQFFLAKIDLLLHTEYDANSNIDPFVLSREVKQKFLTAPVLPTDAILATFDHIFANAYAAGYYSYKWAEVIEADMFSRFEKEGILNPETGRAYAREILARGDEADPNELVKNFLGRQASPAAVLKRDGIS